MRKLSLLFLVLIVLMIAAPAFAQTGGSAPVVANPMAKALTVVGIGLGMGLAAGLAGLGQGKVAGSVAEALARNPGARAGIQLSLFVGLAFIESLVLFTFVLLILNT